jgi:general secretion pathway protein J
MNACQRNKRKTMAGFSLLEALISTVLMAIVLSALATITAQWLPNWNRGVAQVQRDEFVALGLERLLADFAATAFVPPSSETRAPLFEGTDRSVIFVRTSLGPNSGPGLDIVRIAEVNSEQGFALVRTRAPFMPLAKVRLRDLKFGEPVVLLRPPFRLLFAYAGQDRKWQDGWRDQILLPNAVKLTVRHGASQNTRSISTTAIIPAQLSVECIAVKSFADCMTLLARPPVAADGAPSRT